VEELLPKALRVKGLFPAGRLDADSTGLVLLTDDGDLAHRMLAPKSHVPKYYLVRLKKPFQPSYERRLSKGIVLSDGTVCLPAQARKLETAGSYALICLHEGKYHQVKRMFAAVNNHVEMLHRVAVGGLVLPENMPVGGYLEMLHKDVETMLKSGTFEDIYERTMTCFSSYLINAEQ
jgi:16S rRNA pseudouridine516 synthase